MSRTGPLQRLAGGLILILAAGLRLSDPPSHFRAGRLVPADADAAMHYRRALAWATEGWPPVVDPSLAFPDGAALHWSPGWSAALGAFGWVVSGGRPGSTAFDIGVAVFPLIVGVASVWLAAALARRLWGGRAGLVAGLVAALLPIHVAATELGLPDHNAAEGFFLLAFAAEAARDRPRTWAVALLTAGVCLAWVGGFAYAAIGAFSLMVAALIDPAAAERPLERAGVPGLALGAGLLAPAALANGLEAGHLFSYAFFSAFQPAWVAAVAAGSAWLLLLRYRPELRGRLLLAGGSLLAAGAAAVGPAAVEGLRQWLARENPWLATIQEMHPILKGPPWDPASWETATLVLSWAFPAVPALILALGWRAWRERRAGEIAALIGAGVAWGLCFLQVRFGWTCAPLMAAVIGGALGGLPYSPALILLIFLRPPQVLRTAYLDPKIEQNHHQWTFQAYRWLGEQAPPVDPEEPEYGVLATWGHGHWITVIGRHPQYIGHFGSYAGGIERFHQTEAMYRGSEEALAALMGENRLRYLLVDAAEAMGSDGPLRQLLVGGSAGSRNPALTRLRAVFASLEDPGVPFEGVPGTWIYELVPGALVSGRGEPGQEVSLKLPLFYSGQWRSWSAETRVGADGRWRQRVPYWTGAGGWVPTGARYQARIGERSIAFEVPRGAVVGGAELRLGRR